MFALIAALILGGSRAAFAADIRSDPSAETVDVTDIPEYDSEPYIIINDNQPFFGEDEITAEVFEIYSDLDDLGRCGTAYANICQELMPTDERESISGVKPAGWINNPYSFVEGGYVYNRCHLIAFQLAAENATEENLITGTRYLNVTGMLPFENMVADYVKETDNHVLYRVTPLYEGKNLVADGVLMEAYSVEDEGEGICFCVFVYNVQPGVEINYTTGENWADGTLGNDEETTDLVMTEEALRMVEELESDTEATYVLNTRSMKIHRPTCSSVAKMSDKNKQVYTGSMADLIREGYTGCGSCNP